MTLASFRDPKGRVLKDEGKILRFLSEEGVEDYNLIKNSDFIKKMIYEGGFISSKELTEQEKENLFKNESVKDIVNSIDAVKILSHEKIFFPAFPYEWSSMMLYDAAMMTIDFSIKLLEEGLGLKDATPFNILYDGNKPVFIDLLSIEKRSETDPIWLSYGQFQRMFILPLFFNKYYKKPLKDIFLNRTDGIDIEEAYGYLKGFQKFKRKAFSLISMPYFLSRKKQNESMYSQKEMKNKDLAKFVLSTLYKRAKRTLKSLKPNAKKSNWSNYMEELDHYTKVDFEIKEGVLKDLLKERSFNTTLDVGCNTGHFSKISAKSGSKVVSIDYDLSSLNKVYEEAKKEKLDILPLCVNICRPTPGVGWKNSEYESFINRAHKKFDLVLMLAVIHHMIVTDRILMEEIAELAASITKSHLLIEFVGNDDIMFKKIARGRDELYKHITLDYFKMIFSRFFVIKKEKKLASANRWLFVMKKK